MASDGDGDGESRGEGEGEVRVITFWGSPIGLRVEFALAAKGVRYDRALEEDHWFHKSPLLLRSNPVHRLIPVLLHRGRPPLPESLVIIHYIDDTWPSPPGAGLLPDDPYRRATARFWADYVDRKLYPALRGILRYTGDAQSRSIQEALECLSTLENVLATEPEEPPFFGGATLGLVDMVFGPLVAWFPGYEAYGNFKFEFEDKFPRLQAWRLAIKDSPCGGCLPKEEEIIEFIFTFEEKFLRNTK